MSVNQRLKFFAEQRGLTAYRMAKDSNLPIPTVSAYLKGAKSVGSENLCLIVAAYPDLSAEWLLRGSGEMLNRSQETEPARIAQ